MNDYYRVSEAARILSVSASTIRRWEKEGILTAKRTIVGNHRVFDKTEVNKLANGGGEHATPKRVVHYIRSSSGQEASLATQRSQLIEAYGQPMRVFSDKASGLNEKRPGLQSLLNQAEKGNITHVAITHQDRLTRFGYSYLERLLKSYNVEVLVLHERGHASPHEELMKDFMSLIASFSGKFYRLRGHEQQRALLADAQKRLP